MAGSPPKTSMPAGGPPRSPKGDRRNPTGPLNRPRPPFVSAVSSSFSSGRRSGGR